MLASCIHCQSDLGRNELIETLPIGRKIAFDEATGRLWVICGSCARWNLVPFESRYEAIEASERIYRDAKRRMSTGEIGLAKTSEGTDLVRIGAPLRPEMAAWRYGQNFTKRRWKYATTIGPAIGLIAFAPQIARSLPYDSLVAPLGHSFSYALSILSMLLLPSVSSSIQRRFIMGKTLARLPLPNGDAPISRQLVHQILVDPTGPDSESASLRIWIPIPEQSVEDQPWLQFPILNSLVRAIRVTRDTSASPDSVSFRVTPKYLDEPTHFTSVNGAELGSALRVVLPVMNEPGASRSVVRHATDFLSTLGSTPHDLLFNGRQKWEKEEVVKLHTVNNERRLALEMHVHEDSERRWLAGELLDLNAEWQKANEIATIADALLRDPAIETALDELRDRTPRPIN
jgi:hypothetical protein